MNKTVYNAILVVGTVLLVAGGAGTVIKRLWRN